MRAVDLFSGTGWAVACRELGIEETGIDIDPAVIATRKIHGFKTVPVPVEVCKRQMMNHAGLLLASPPCQPFSKSNRGRKAAMESVLENVERVSTGREILHHADARAELVVQPLRWALRSMPPLLAWEQVPAVLPVWEACAATLELAGYSTWTGLLRAEQFGVPQTRERAFLLARNDGVQVAPPVPTHSKLHRVYHHRMDADVKPWITMAQALGWQKGIDDVPEWVFRRPCTTIAGDPRIGLPGHKCMKKTCCGRGEVDRQFPPGSLRITPHQAQLIQTYPAAFEFAGSAKDQYRQIGNAVPPLLAGAVIQALIAPKEPEKGLRP